MKPYYEHAGITIYHGDCRQVMPALPVLADCIVADPPYGDTALDWDRQVSGWGAVALGSLSTRGSMWVFGSLRFLLESNYKDEFSGWKLAQDIVWEKHNGSSFHADRFKRVHELIVQFYCGDWENVYKNPVTTSDATARTVRSKARPPHMGNVGASDYTSKDGGPRLMRSVVYVPSCHGVAQHPTQKPIGIIHPLLAYSCPEKGIVLDPFMGAGSVLLAAKARGICAIGIESQERYCEIAAGRLSQEVLDLK